MAAPDALQAVETFGATAIDIIKDMTIQQNLSTPDKENLRKRLAPVLSDFKAATSTLRASAAVNGGAPSKYLHVVQQTSTVPGSRTDLLGIAEDCYEAMHKTDMSKDLREVSRGRNPCFARVIHLVRDTLLVSPAASPTFIDFLVVCEKISEDQPSFDNCPMRTTNRFHGFRLYALLTRDEEIPDSSRYLNVRGLREEVLAAKFTPNSPYSKEFRLLLPLFLSLKGYPTILSPGAWEIFFRFPGTVDDDKQLEARAASEPLSDASREVVKRAKNAGLFPYLSESIQSGAAIRDPIQAHEALQKIQSIQRQAEERSYAASQYGQAPANHANQGQGAANSSRRGLEADAKRSRAENGTRDREFLGTKGAYTVKIGDKSVPMPSQAERITAVRTKGLCRFCGHKGHGHRIAGNMTECPVNGNSEHFNPKEPWEFAYLVAIHERDAK